MGMGKEPLEMIEANPFAAKDTQADIEIAERNLYAVHRCVFKNNEIDHPGQDQQMQKFLAAQGLPHFSQTAFLYGTAGAFRGRAYRHSVFLLYPNSSNVKVFFIFLSANLYREV